MSTSQQFTTVNVAKLEVEGAWPSLPNIVPNPKAEYGAWGWRHKVQSATLSAISGPAFRLARGAFAASCSTDLLPLEPNWGPGSSNRWVRGSIRRTGGTSGMQVSIQFLDKTGSLLSATTLTTTQTTNGTIALAAVQAPSLAKYAALNIVHNGASSGNTIEFTDAILVTGTQTAVTTATLAVEAPWVDVLSPATSIQIRREGLNVGTLSAVVRSSSLDPATTSTIRKGKRLRVTALSSGSWELLFNGQVDTASSTYDFDCPDASKRTRIELTGVDNVSRLAAAPRVKSVATIAELPDVLDGAKVPWNVNGSTDPVWPSTGVASDPNASALTQVALTRDTVSGFAWVSRKGVLNAWDRGTISTTVVATINEAVYTDLETGFNPADLINDVTVKCRTIDAVTGENVEITYGPFTDDVSAREWGKFHKDFTVVGAWSAATAEAFANAVLTNSSQPRVRVNAVQLPVTDTAHIASTRALLDLYDVVTVVNTATSVNQNLRVTDITHTIEPDRWTMELGFSEVSGVASPATPDPRNTFAPQAVGTRADTAWAALPYAAGFSDFGSPWATGGYCRRNGIVYLRGLIVGTRVAGTVIATLPAGFRPGADMHVAISANGASAIVEIYKTGEIKWNSGSTSSWLSLSNVDFPAEL